MSSCQTSCQPAVIHPNKIYFLRPCSACVFCVTRTYNVVMNDTRDHGHGTFARRVLNGDPMPKRQTSKPNGKRSNGTSAAPFVPARDIAHVWDMARVVNASNFADALAIANTGHGVTHTGRNTCRFTGVRIQFAQNETFIQNDKPENRLSDLGLLFVWCVRFPMATGAVFAPNRPGSLPLMASVHIVNGARRSFNAGKHGNPIAPASPSTRYAVVPSTVVPSTVVPSTKPTAKPTTGRLVKR